MSGEALHAQNDLWPNQWWGCSEPERRYDEFEVWDERCPKCLMRMRLVLATEGDIRVFDALELSQSKGRLFEVLEAIAP